MDVVGSEIGHKMRSAIKAKLTELGCYVDDELPDYVMVMVANKRTRAQMEDDLQLFLGDNTELFVNWLHQVLKKLQEVTVTTPISQPEKPEKPKAKSDGKEPKTKVKKDKSKDKPKRPDGSKKSKKKDKEKKKKKELKKSHKGKKKSKGHEMIRPNIPPLLMNMEKESEPSITDVFAGQILKNHGILMEPEKDDPKVETKPVVSPIIKRSHFPIIDPATISSQPVTDTQNNDRNSDQSDSNEKSPKTSQMAKPHQFPPREEQIKEITKIEAKIQDLRQKLAEKNDSMSDDEDFLNIRTEAEELMNDFVEDVYQEIISIKPPCTNTPPLQPQKSQNIPPPAPKLPEASSSNEETLPQIELQLPKRPLRERLGSKAIEAREATKRRHSPERFTPEKDPQAKSSVRSRLGDPPESQRRLSLSEEPNYDKALDPSKRLTSKVSALDGRENRAAPASVVRVRPRPRPTVGAPASALLLRAVADAHKSLLNIPPKVSPEPARVQRALVMPMRRGVEAQKIVIEVPTGSVPSAAPAPAQEVSDCEIDFDTESLADLEIELDNSKANDRGKKEHEYIPAPITRTLFNKTIHYVPSKRSNSKNSKGIDVPSIEVETINIHNTTVDKEAGPQFVVTLDGLDPNVFLAKKLRTEGLIEDEEMLDKTTSKHRQSSKTTEKIEKSNCQDLNKPIEEKCSDVTKENDAQAASKNENEVQQERKSEENVENVPIRKRKASPIVFDVDKKQRERKESVSSDNQVTVATTTSTTTSKYDSLPSLPQEKRSLPCRAFPACRWGAACAFTHPPCKFAAACTRRSCVYQHPPPNAGPATKMASVIASHVVPAANFKSISSAGVPSMCKYYPQCSNPACHYFHPKLCRYGKACLNKLQCNFYHHDVPNSWRGGTFKV